MAGGAANGGNHMVGFVDHAANGFDPSAMLTDFDYGDVSTDPDGRTVRQWVVTAVDREIEIAPGVMFPAWTYDGRVPGRTFRGVEGERLRFVFQNGGSHPHSMHFHGMHSWRMDGVQGAGVIQPGEEYVYEFDARPFGCHLYHCHAMPLKRHLHKGMYGAFIIDPDPDRHPAERAAAAARRHGTPEHARWQELVMVMNGFDTNFDDENEVYAVNSIPFAYVERPAADRAEPAGAGLSGQPHRVRPDQLVPPARQLLRLLRPRHDARADPPHHRHGDACARASAASSSSATPSTSPGSTCSTPTSPSSPSSAG